MAARRRRPCPPSPASTVRACPLSAGSYFEDEQGHRIIRVLGFHQADPTDLPWAHPVDGVVAYVDMTRGMTTDVQDFGVMPIPAERADLDQQTHPHAMREPAASAAGRPRRRRRAPRR